MLFPPACKPAALEGSLLGRGEMSSLARSIAARRERSATETCFIAVEAQRRCPLLAVGGGSAWGAGDPPALNTSWQTARAFFT